jgi:uncharacterized membrane protein
MAQVVPLHPLVPGDCSNGAPTGDITKALNSIVGLMTAVGAAVCAIGVAIGGLMRATSFGSERRISDSNTAIACAVVGLLVVLLAQAIGGWVGGLITPGCTPPAGTGTAAIFHVILGLFS